MDKVWLPKEDVCHVKVSRILFELQRITPFYKPKRCELHPDVGQGQSFVRKNERPFAIPQKFSITARDHQSSEAVKLFVCVVLVPELAFKLGFVFLVHPGKFDDDL